MKKIVTIMLMVCMAVSAFAKDFTSVAEKPYPDCEWTLYEVPDSAKKEAVKTLNRKSEVKKAFKNKTGVFYNATEIENADDNVIVLFVENGKIVDLESYTVADGE